MEVLAFKNSILSLFSWGGGVDYSPSYSTTGCDRILLELYTGKAFVSSDASRLLATTIT